jgi:glutaredoxin
MAESLPMFSWWRATETEMINRQVVLYTRRGCHLCEDAYSFLQLEQQQHGFALTTIDVDADSELAARYDTCVPVVTVDGKERFRGRINAVLWRRLFRSA